MAPTCTDPNLNTTFALDEDAGVIGPLPDTFRYPSRKGWDEFFGYGRLDALQVGRSRRRRAGSRRRRASPRRNGSSRSTPSESSFDARRLRRRAQRATPAASKSRRARSRTTPRPPPRATSHSVPSSYCDGTTRAQQAVQRTARDRQHGDARGDVPERRPDLVQRQRERRPRLNTVLQRAPQHAALRVHRTRRRRDRAGRGRAEDDRRGPPPAVPAPRRRKC